MYEAKTKETDESVIDFINKVEHPRKRVGKKCFGLTI